MGKFLQHTKAIIFLIAFIFAVSYSFSQNGDPPPPPGEHGQTGNQPVGGGATIGSGLFLMLLMGAGYGARKWYLKKAHSTKS